MRLFAIPGLNTPRPEPPIGPAEVCDVRGASVLLQRRVPVAANEDVFGLNAPSSYRSADQIEERCVLLRLRCLGLLHVAD